MRKILVTGATGFIGNYVIRELLKTNSIKIVATSRNKSKAKQYDWFNKVTYIPYDLEKPFEQIWDYFHYPDALIHLAWDGLLDYDNANHTDNYLFQHYRFIQQIVEEGVKDVSVIGTCLEVGMKEGRLDEDISTNPVTRYGLAKDTLRRLLELELKNKKVSYKWIRLFYLYGPGQRKKSLIGQLEKAIKNNSKTFAMSGGEQLRDYLPVSTASEYIVSIAIQNQVLGVINCCSGMPVSVLQFVENYLRQVHKKIKLEIGVYPYPKHEPFAFWGNKTKLNLILN